MDKTDAFTTHQFSDGNVPHQVTQDGKTILHHRCTRCARDFAQGLDGAGWQAAYVGVLRIELLADSVNDRWLTEECPGRLIPQDDVDRAVRRS